MVHKRLTIASLNNFLSPPHSLVSIKPGEHTINQYKRGGDDGGVGDSDDDDENDEENDSEKNHENDERG